MSKQAGKIKALLYVAFSRGMSLLSGVAVGLLLPKVLSVQDYGFLKIYTLYVTYTALLHLGFADGVLLRLAGMEYGELDKRRMRLYTRFFVSFQTLIGVAMMVAGLLVKDGDYSFILIMLGVNMIVINMTTYYQFVSQATKRFAEFSARNLMSAVIKFLFVAALLLGQTLGWFRVSYKIYVFGLNLMDIALLLWYICTYRDITFGARDRLKGNWGDIWSLFRQGILLTVAYQVSHLVFMLDRQFVSVLYDTKEYAVYSFAYNIVTLINTMIASLSVVLLPMLKRADRSYIEAYFGKTLSAIAVLVGAAIICYFPLVVFIDWFLPAYQGSVVYLKIVVPSLMYSCCLSVVMFTFAKILDQNLGFFKTGLLALAIGFVTNAAAYAIFGTPESISCASLLTLGGWFLIEGRRLGKTVNGKISREFAYITVLAVGFLAITLLLPSVWLGCAVYVVFYLVATAAFYRSDIPALLGNLKRICSRK